MLLTTRPSLPSPSSPSSCVAAAACTPCVYREGGAWEDRLTTCFSIQYNLLHIMIVTTLSHHFPSPPLVFVFLMVCDYKAWDLRVLFEVCFGFLAPMQQPIPPAPCTLFSTSVLILLVWHHLILLGEEGERRWAGEGIMRKLLKQNDLLNTM